MTKIVMNVRNRKIATILIRTIHQESEAVMRTPYRFVARRARL
jgi:hypothetical protein